MGAEATVAAEGFARGDQLNLRRPLDAKPGSLEELDLGHPAPQTEQAGRERRIQRGRAHGIIPLHIHPAGKDRDTGSRRFITGGNFSKKRRFFAQIRPHSPRSQSNHDPSGQRAEITESATASRIPTAWRNKIRPFFTPHRFALRPRQQCRLRILKGKPLLAYRGGFLEQHAQALMFLRCDGAVRLGGEEPVQLVRVRFHIQASCARRRFMQSPSKRRSVFNLL